ncbi:DC-STAMP-like protein [Pristimantis euphronides]
MFALMNVFRSSLFAAIVIGLDYLFYYILYLVPYLMSGEVIAEPPFAMSMVIQGSGYSDEIYKRLASAYEAMQNRNVTSITKKCQIHPSEPDYLQYILIGLLHGLVAFIAAFGVYIQWLRRYICAYYYPTREKIHICFLYNQLLTKRLHLDKALFQSIRNNKGDQGHTNILLILAAQCPFFFSWLAKFVGANQEYCLACAQATTIQISIVVSHRVVKAFTVLNAPRS